MKADLREELDLLNKNVDEMIRLFQRTADAGIWNQKEATRHEARLESIRKKLNADYREITAMRERTRKESTPVKPRS
jgi:DNA repair exonuclease SbcCD ATPase subunit